MKTESDVISRLISPKNDKTGLLYLIISGVAIGFCVTFPTVIGLLLQWIAFVPASLAIYSMSEESPKRNVIKRFFSYWRTGFLFFMSEYLVIYHWFVSMYPLEFTGMSKGAAVVVVIFGWVGLSVLGSLGGAVIFALTVLFCGGRTALRHRIIRPFIIAFLYPLFEWLETNFWTGVPWNRLGLGQLCGNFTLTLLSSSLLGPYFTSFLIILTSALTAYGLKYGKVRKYAGLALCVFIGNIICGLCVMSMSSAGEQVSAAAVQGNFSSGEKWSASMDETFSAYKRLTESAAENGAQIVIWPETAMPVTVYDGIGYDRDFSRLSDSCDIYLIVGCFENRDGEMCNVLRCYDPDGAVLPDSYSKRHLVPFGEYIPERVLFEKLVPPLTEISILDRQLLEGKEVCNKVLGGHAAGFVICFDSIYENLFRESVAEGADFILMATNDSWFGTSRALGMHVSQARLRSIENLTPVVRAANTGISACIDRLGRVVTSSAPDTETVIYASMETSGSGSLYSLTGNVFVFICALVLSALTGAELGFSLGSRYRKRKSKSRN
ncbi:MAG: apolipoprotein N-acyltransferase [Clostridia bacterium]|nr:apolipoprotein N-acyltransferase [Clostridia bacterium]